VIQLVRTSEGPAAPEADPA